MVDERFTNYARHGYTSEKALIHARNILIDNSFDALTADVEDDYTFSEIVKEAHADE